MLLGLWRDFSIHTHEELKKDITHGLKRNVFYVELKICLKIKQLPRQLTSMGPQRIGIGMANFWLKVRVK